MPRRSRVNQEAELKNFAIFHQLILPPPHYFEVRETSTRHLAAAFVEMLWMYGPKFNNLFSVALRNFGCGLWRRRVLCQFAVIGVEDQF